LDPEHAAIDKMVNINNTQCTRELITEVIGIYMIDV